MSKKLTGHVMELAAYFLVMCFSLGVITMHKPLFVLAGYGLILWYMVARFLVFMYGEKL